VKTPNAPKRNEIRRSLRGNGADPPGHEGLLTRAAPRQRALPALPAAAAACAAVSLNSKSAALPKKMSKSAALPRSIAKNGFDAAAKKPSKVVEA